VGSRAGFFRTEGAVNPIFTANSPALRSAEKLAADLAIFRKQAPPQLALAMQYLAGWK